MKAELRNIIFGLTKPFHWEVGFMSPHNVVQPSDVAASDVSTITGEWLDGWRVVVTRQQRSGVPAASR